MQTNQAERQKPLADGAGQTFMDGIEVERCYRRGFGPKLYMQGYAEASHGISDTLPSVVAVRVQETSRAIFDAVVVETC